MRAFASFRVVGLLCALCSLQAFAQGTKMAPDPTLIEPNELEHVPKVPGVSLLWPGVNVGLTFTAVHDSAIGWYTLATPAVSYTFSPRYSADASMSVYPYRLAQNQSTAPAPQPNLIAIRGDVSDILLGFHTTFTPHKTSDIITASITVPSGSRQDGLSTGRVTFDASNHVEGYFGRTGVIVDVGFGDSSGLFNRLVNNEYSSLGPIAHFQTGLVIWMIKRSYVQSVAYEQLPIGDQKVYMTLTRPGYPNRTVVSGRNVSEDNGFTTSVGIPVTSKITLSGYYNRSLRLHLDITGMSVTYVLRGTPRKRRLSLIDRALQEGMAGSTQ
jgi:hypothetical protein